MHPSLENRFYDLVGRKLSGECQPAELKELESILQSHPELQFFYDQIVKAPSGTTDQDIASAWLTHAAKMTYARRAPGSINSRRRIAVKRTLVRTLIAASAAFVLVLMWPLSKKNKTVPGKSAIAATGAHKEPRSIITLPDGTIVRLNAKSTVTPGKGFGTTTREVLLTGEAYFEVTHNEKLPFIVHTDQADIRVLGTTFNVRSYSNEHRMEAALLTGSIELTLHEDTRHKILLKPSDKIIVKNADDDKDSSAAVRVKKVELTRIKVRDSVIIETSWLTDKMAFFDKPLSEIASDLERQFDVNIEFKNEAVRAYKYTGVYDEATAEDILKILQIVKPFKYSINNQRITIY